jgi:hypothetical protein
MPEHRFGETLQRSRDRSAVPCDVQVAVEGLAAYRFHDGRSWSMGSFALIVFS